MRNFLFVSIMVGHPAYTPVEETQSFFASFYFSPIILFRPNSL